MKSQGLWKKSQEFETQIIKKSQGLWKKKSSNYTDILFAKNFQITIEYSYQTSRSGALILIFLLFRINNL